MKKIFFILVIVCVTIFVACEKSAESSAAIGSVGVGGSLARFTIVNNYLYIADDTKLKTYNITNTSQPQFVSEVEVGQLIETIYPYSDKLFLGGQQGMYIYSLTNPDRPVKLSQAVHVRACDPVVAKDTFAFVTLRSGTRCGTATNALYTYGIGTITNPVLLNTLPLPNPKGLGYKDSTLFVACEDSGLAVINIKQSNAPIIKQYIKGNSFSDVICLGNTLVCLVKTGISLYDISNVNNITLIKNIAN